VYFPEVAIPQRCLPDWHLHVDSANFVQSRMITVMIWRSCCKDSIPLDAITQISRLDLPITSATVLDHKVPIGGMTWKI
jgi:hypothetical protein